VHLLAGWAWSAHGSSRWRFGSPVTLRLVSSQHSAGEEVDVRMSMMTGRRDGEMEESDEVRPPLVSASPKEPFEPSMNKLDTDSNE